MRTKPVYFLSLFSLALASPASTQAVTEIAQTQDGARLKAAVPRRVSATYENAPLTVVLKDIASKARVRVNYRDNDLRGAQVSLTLKDAPVDAAFLQALRGTRLVASQLSQDEWTVAIKQGAKGIGQGIVAGKVTDAKTGKGIAGASISTGTDNRGVSTDETGSYRLGGVVPGTHAITVRLVGYAKQTKSVTVGEGATITVDFRLEPTASVLDQVVVTGTATATELKAVPNAITVITAKQIEQRGITSIDQLFRGDVPGLFAVNRGSAALLGEVTMFSRGATALSNSSAGAERGTNPMKTYLDGVEIADPKYLSQIDPASIERIEILTGPQASTIYGSNAINGVMQIFTKRGTTSRPQLVLNLTSGWVENNYSSARTPQHDYSAQVGGNESRISYNAGGSWNYVGPWTAAKQVARTNGFAGIRFVLPTALGQVTSDMNFRRTLTQNRGGRGTTFAAQTYYQEIGLHVASIGGAPPGLGIPTTSTVRGQTLGFTLAYVPTSWWSHEFGLGQDAEDAERLKYERGYFSPGDTTLEYFQSHVDRRSLRYTTTATIPIASVAQAMVTFGADAWQGVANSLDLFPPVALTGSLTSNSYITSRYPAHNSGGFMQAQLGAFDRLFVTYGLRAEWNSNYGDEAEPNYAPRFGVAFTQELGTLTSKLRASYGRSTRPPAPNLKAGERVGNNSPYISGYGNMYSYVPNSELAPEHQRGSEGGVEFYFGNRGSLVVTRYNQTVDGLIADPLGADSARSLNPNPILFGLTCAELIPFGREYCSSQDAAGYGYVHQRKYINIGSIRNQGWETQGSINTGPVTTRGTYSWTKSRTIGIDPKYSTAFDLNIYPQYRPGATFKYLPEHTYAVGVTYSKARTNIALNLTGTAQTRKDRNDVYMQSLNPNIRLLQNRLNVIVSQGIYANFGQGYTIADITASHRLLDTIDGIFQIQNLGNRYTTDFDDAFAAIGRQGKIGVRVRL